MYGKIMFPVTPQVRQTNVARRGGGGYRGAWTSDLEEWLCQSQELTYRIKKQTQMSGNIAIYTAYGRGLILVYRLNLME